jgi:hypothetical protein
MKFTLSTKKLLFLFICTLVAVSTKAQVEKDDNEDEGKYIDSAYENDYAPAPRVKRCISLYLTGGGLTLNSNNFNNAEIVDYDKSEVIVPFSDNNISGIKPSANLGANFPLSGRVDLVLSFQGAWHDNFHLYSQNAGIGFFIISKPGFELSVQGTLGFVESLIDFGDIHISQPIYMGNGKFIADGNHLQTSMTGGQAQLGLRPVVPISSRLAIEANAGYTFGMLRNPTIHILESNGYDKLQINLVSSNTTVNLQGIYFQAGIQWKIARRTRDMHIDHEDENMRMQMN